MGFAHGFKKSGQSSRQGGASYFRRDLEIAMTATAGNVLMGIAGLRAQPRFELAGGVVIVRRALAKN